MPLMNSRQRCLCLWKPERQVHGTGQHNSRGQLGASLLLLADRGTQCAEAPVAVGLEQAHAEFLGEGEGLAVVGGCLVDVRGSAMHGDRTEEAQSIRLVAPFLART